MTVQNFEIGTDPRHKELFSISTSGVSINWHEVRQYAAVPPTNPDSPYDICRLLLAAEAYGRRCAADDALSDRIIQLAISMESYGVSLKQHLMSADLMVNDGLCARMRRAAYRLRNLFR